MHFIYFKIYRKGDITVVYIKYFYSAYEYMPLRKMVLIIFGIYFIFH